jgi:hypothetical protein
MPQSLVNFDNALKETYGPGLRNAVNGSNVVWAEAVKNEDDLIGEEAVWSIHSGRSNSTGARGELATLPTADRQRHLKARRGLTFQYHTIKVSGPSKHLTRGDEGAFARALETEIKGAEKDLKNSMSRQVFGQAVTVNGALRTGVIATLSADPGASADFVFANEDESVMRHFYPGMLLDVINPADGTDRAGSPVEVLSVNKSTRTVTMTAAANAAVASGDMVVQASSDGGNSLDKEIDGLRYLISASGSYAGIDPATNPVWKAISVGSTTTGVSEVIFDEAQETVETDGDGSTPELFVAEHVQRRKLASLLQAQKRYDGRDMTLTSGWKGLQIAQGSLVADRYCPTTYAFALTRSEINKFVGLDFQWDEDDGEVLYKALDGSDAVEARFKGYVNLAATLRNAHAVIRLSSPSF